MRVFNLIGYKGDCIERGMPRMRKPYYESGGEKWKND